MRALACPRCRAGAGDLSVFVRGVCEWTGSAWRWTGEHDRCWLNCYACGHSWRTKRHPHDVAEALR